MGKNRFPVWIYLLTVGMLFSVISCSSKEEKVASFISKGDQLLEKGDPTRALLEYKNALQIDPQSRGAVLGLGNAFLAQEQYQKAYSVFVSALAANPDLDDVRLQVAWLLTMARQGQKALEEIERLKEPEKYRRKVNLIKAVAYFSLERYQDVIDTLSLVEGSGDDKNVQMLLAQTLKSLNARESMENAAERWRALDPKDPGPYLFMARIAAESGNEAGAVSELQRMVESDPGDFERVMLQARTLEVLGLVKQADAAYERLPDDSATLRAKADYWTRRGDRVKARAELENLVAVNPGEVDAVIRLGQLLIELNDTASAMALLDKTLKIELKKPDREKIVLAKATLKAQQAQWDEAKKLCETVLGEDQGNIDAHLLLGKILLGMNQLTDAEIHLSQAAASRPDNEQCQILLAQSQFLGKKEPQAVLTLKKALETNPKSLGLRMELIRYHLGKDETDQVSSIIDKGLEIQRDDIALLRTRGEFEASLKNYSKAEQSLRRIIEVRPNSAIGYIEMGRLMLLQSRNDEGIDLLRQAMDKEDGLQLALPVLVDTYLSRNEPQAALSLVKNESIRHPESALVQYYLGHTLSVTGDPQGAEAAFTRAAELSPGWLVAYNGLADAFLRQGKVSEAIAKIQEAYRINPSDHVLFQLAMLYERAGRYEDAIRVCGELVGKSVGGPELMNNLAYLYAEHGTDAQALQKATDLMAKALARQPENPSFLDTAAWVAYMRGELDTSWYKMQSALARAPAEGLHCLHAAVILHARGEGKQSLEYLDKVLQQKTDPKLQERARDLRKEWTVSSN